MPNWKKHKSVQFLQELVDINSGTNHFAGVRAVQDRVAQHLSQLGLPFSFKAPQSGTPNPGKILVSEVNGTPGAPFINLVTHADTVFEKDSGFLDFKFNRDGKTATGPGIIDDKGGIVIALDGLQKFLKEHPKSLNIRFLCTPTEEIGSPGFESLFKKYSENSWMVLGFEPSLEDGSIVCSRRGNRWYDIRVHGKEAHAGRDHKSGVNAAHELAAKITRFHDLTDYSRDLTLSIGQISGGSKFNVVCGEAQAKLDVRFSDFKTRDQAHKKIEAILKRTHIRANKQGVRPETDYTIANDCPPFSVSKSSKNFLDAFLKVIKKVESRQVKATQAGGAADSNYMSREGLIIIDGLGATGGGMHQKSEFIRLDSLETRSDCLALYLEYSANYFKTNRISKK